MVSNNDDREAIEYSLAHIIPNWAHKDFPRYIDDTVFFEVKELLTQHPDPRMSAWKDKPRLYTLLHMLGYHHEGQVFARFEKEQHGDFWLPLGSVALDQLASTAGFSASHFSRAQNHVLSRSDQMSEEKLFSPLHFHRHILYGSSHFEDKERIGEGGSSEVVRVKHKLSGREFACKRILRKPSLQAQAAQLIEFEQEVGVLQKISHPHFIRFVASFTDLRSFSLILEPVASDVLKDMLERQTHEQPLSNTDISTLRQSFGCLSTAVAYLHQQKVRHKDIKPGNVLISGGRILLCDFGVSLDWSKSDQSTTEGMPHKFTYRYSAPEVRDRDRRNSKSDIWSLGCVFLEIITVVKGHTIDEFQRFLTENNTGEGASGLWYTPEAMSAWIEKIKSTNHDSADDLPLSWIIPMFRVDADQRVEASETVDLIHKHAALNPDPSLFVAPCCSRSDSIAHSGVIDTPTITNPRLHRDKGLGISHASASPPRFLNLPQSNHSPRSIDERSRSNVSRTDESLSSHDRSISPRARHDLLAKESSDAVPFQMDPPKSPTNITLKHISPRVDSQQTSLSFPQAAKSTASSSDLQRLPVPPAADYEVECKCASRPLERHIFNAPFIALGIDEALNISGAPSIDAAILTAEISTQCEIGENKVQIYESPPEDPGIKNGQIPMMWWVTRRLVISYLAGSPKTRRCASFWLPLADVQFIRAGPEVTLRWSDCNQMTQRSSGNYSQHYDWLYNPKSPNNGLSIRFHDDINAQRYIDTLRLPYEDGAIVSHGRTIDASPSSEVQVFDVRKRGVRNYRIAVVTNNKASLVTSKLFIQWPDLDLSIHVDSFPPAGYQMTVELQNVSTPTYYSDVRGEPAVDHKKTGRFYKAFKIKAGFAVTFPIDMGHGVPVPPPGVVDLFQALTGWTLRYLGVVECFKTKRKHFGSKKQGRASVMLWERTMSSGQRGLQITFRQQEESDFLWTSGTLTSSSSVSFPGSGTDVTLSVFNKMRGGLLDVSRMAAIAGEEEKEKDQTHARKGSNAGEELSELVLTCEFTHYRLALITIIEEFKSTPRAQASMATLRYSTAAALITNTHLDMLASTTLLGSEGGNMTPLRKATELDLTNLDKTDEGYISNDEDIGSQIRTEARTPAELYAVKVIGSFFGDSRELRLLHERLLKRLSYNRFVHKYRRALKVYVLRLQELSGTRTHIENIAIRVLKSRQNRIDIARRIIEVLNQDDEDPPRLFDPMDYQRVEKDSLTSWVNNIKVIEQEEHLPENIENGDIDDGIDDGIDDDSDSDHDSERNPTNLQRDFETDLLSVIAGVEESLRRNIDVLSLELGFLALPVPSRELVESVPKEDIRILHANDTSFSNKIKTFIEDNTSIEWDWWPFRPRVPDLPPDKQCLLEWQVSRYFYYRAISLAEAAEIQGVIDQISNHPRKCYCCAAKASQQDPMVFIKIASKSFTASMIGKFRNSWTIYTSTSAAQQRYTPSAAAAALTSSADVQYMPRATPLQSGGIAGNIVQAQSCGANNIPLGLFHIPAWVIFGIKDGSDFNDIENIGMSNLLMHDAAFFAELKRLENRYRWPLLRWISPYIFTYCKFVQFDTMNVDRIYCCGEFLPEDHGHEAHYQYHPRPPSVKNPPIGKQEFMRCLRTCESFCLWSYLLVFRHRCSRHHSDSHKWKRIPRRTSAFDPKAAQPGEVAYGLEAVHVLSFPMIFFYHLLSILAWFGFWIWWLEGHPNDLQNASVPMMVFLGIVASFWVLPGRKRDI